MQYKLGFEPKMYIGPAGSVPTTEAKNVKDVTVNLESAEVDASSRQSGIFKFYLAGQIDPSIEFTMNADADDTVQTSRPAWARELKRYEYAKLPQYNRRAPRGRVN